MSLLTWADSKVKILNWSDIALVKLCCIVIGLIFAILIPSLVDIKVYWYILVAIILAIKPKYKVFRK